ncbi:MAG: hypothetical protein KAX65_10500 [Caldilineaceae bacterium]|nr:hypothetical protein [Caldilineaceae bacterium]
MTALPLLGWLVAGVLAIVAWWLWVDLVEARRAAKRQQIRAEEADAWADEHERTATALAAELDGLRQRHATLTELYGEAVRRLLAVNYVVIHTNLKWKRRRQDQ